MRRNGMAEVVKGDGVLFLYSVSCIIVYPVSLHRPLLTLGLV